MEPNWTKYKKEICFIVKVEGKIQAFLWGFLNSRDYYYGCEDPEQMEKYKL